MSVLIQKIREEAQGALNCGFSPWEDEWQFLTRNALNNILKLCDEPPALAPGKHEPEPIILAASQKKRAPRTQKGH